MDQSRRELIVRAGAAGAGLVLASCSGIESGSGASKKRHAPTLSPSEDLMREHGVVHRLALIYDALADRLEAQEALPDGLLLNVTNIVDEFVGGYHEMLEEKFVFPRFEKAGRMKGLVKVLRAQHLRGRRVATEAYEMAGRGAPEGADGRAKLIGLCRGYALMYRAHAAREDTELFPALQGIVGPKEIQVMGERFEREEEDRLGKEGFARTVGEIAGIERELGIQDLSAYTP